MSIDKERIEGACHCGAVRFRARLANGLRNPRRCNCSLCRMRGAVVVSAAVGDLEVTSGADKLATYRFNTMTARHHFCSVCGIYTHHQRRSDPTQYGVNVACLDGVSPFDFPEVLVFDGVRHPADEPGRGNGIAGTLTYVAAPDDEAPITSRTTSRDSGSPSS